MESFSALYGTLLLSGFLGSLGHCLGMCGPLVLMVGAGLRTNQLSLFPHYLLYHTIRITVYALLGALAGVIGSVMGLGQQLSGPAGFISVMLGLGVILFGLSYLGWLPLGRLQGGSDWLSRAMSRAVRRGGRSGVMILGALNGLLPCGLVYSALLLAASTGGALPGLVGMFLFGAATIPALLVLGVGVGSLNVHTRQLFMRMAGVLIVIVGLQLALRGLAALSIIPHLKLGAVMLW